MFLLQYALCGHEYVQLFSTRADDLDSDGFVANPMSNARAAARKLMIIKRNSNGVSLAGVALRGVRRPDVAKDSRKQYV